MQEKVSILHLLNPDKINEEHVLCNLLGYIILLCLLIISRLIEDTQKIVNVINSYTQHLMIPLEIDPELLYKENVKKNIIYEIFASFLFLLMNILVR